MTWLDVTPIERAVAPTAAIRISSTGGVLGRPARVLISIRPTMIPGCPTWLQQPGRVRVQIGSGEHARKLRLQPKGNHQMTACKMGRAKGDGTLHIKLAGLAGLTKFTPKTAAFELFLLPDGAGQGVEITLPTIVQTAATSALVSPPAAAPAGAPKPQPSAGKFSMLGGKL